MGSFTAVAFNGAQMLVVLVTVFSGVIFTLMDSRPILKGIFFIIPVRHHDRTLVILQRIVMPCWAGATLVGMVAIGVMAVVGNCPDFYRTIDATHSTKEKGKGS